MPAKGLLTNSRKEEVLQQNEDTMTKKWKKRSGRVSSESTASSGEEDENTKPTKIRKSKRKQKIATVIEMDKHQWQMPEDVFRNIVRHTTSSSAIVALHSLNSNCRKIVRHEMSLMSRQHNVPIDVHTFFNDQNPFANQLYHNDEKKDAKKLHKSMRRLCDSLESLLNIGVDLSIENLNLSSLGWITDYEDSAVERAPFMLQKRLVHIMKRFHGTDVEYCAPMLKPSRFIRTFAHRFDAITSLDLGSMKNLAVLKLWRNVFPSLKNLEALTWHKANIEYLKKLPTAEKMKKLVVTFHIQRGLTYHDFAILHSFLSLEEVYLGFIVPKVPSRMVMDVLLNLYQAIWSRKMLCQCDGEESNKQLLPELKNVKTIGFWNAPEKFFIDSIKAGLEYETVNFGLVSQDLKKLCSFDSIMQALFRWEESQEACISPRIKNLNLNLHAMPVVPLEYYLPNLMDRVNKMCGMKKLSLFVNCIFGAQMDSSWSMSPKANKRRHVIPADYTHFDLHINGFCVLTDLNHQLPTTLQSLSVSLELPSSEEASKSVRSVVAFLKELGDVNAFPDIEKLRIQITGVRCMEVLVDAIVESVGSSLKTLSLICMPRTDSVQVARNLLRKLASECTSAERIEVSADYLQMIGGKKNLLTSQWRNEVGEIAKENNVDTSKCRLGVGRLPRLQNFHVRPFYPSSEEVPLDMSSSEEEEEEEENEDDMDVDEYEDDSFLEDEDGDEDSCGIVSFDELEEAERDLEKETERRHKKWQSRERVASASSEDVEEDDDDVLDDEEYEDEDEEEEKYSRRKNQFFDDEAEEVDEDDDDEIDEEEEEEEGEDLGDSDDERLINEAINNVQRKRNAEASTKAVKKNRVVVSSDEDEED